MVKYYLRFGKISKYCAFFWSEIQLKVSFNHYLNLVICLIVDSGNSNNGDLELDLYSDDEDNGPSIYDQSGRGKKRLTYHGGENGPKSYLSYSRYQLRKAFIFSSLLAHNNMHINCNLCFLL